MARRLVNLKKKKKRKRKDKQSPISHTFTKKATKCIILLQSMVKCDQKRASSTILLIHLHLRVSSQDLKLSQMRWIFKPNRQPSVSTVRQGWSGRLSGEGTRWLGGSCPGPGIFLWRASHSTSHLQSKSALAYSG